MPNLHACAVSLRGRGVLIAGPSGSGKTRLALKLAALRELDAQFVSDDQVLLEAAGGRLVARAPHAIFGLVEVRGVGPVEIAAVFECAVGLFVQLVPAAESPRFCEEDERETLEGIAIPRLRLPERDADGAVLAIRAFLFGALF
ncbi:MAG: HPr kinase/phosphatase C-terminal domain-containing protein [Methylobacterium mesophilicum]|nr:HPr kinase/phosphatase C-terminal domain-containing protein [Methylobacterium mesophilicum]